jgi:hypothetical protein
MIFGFATVGEAVELTPFRALPTKRLHSEDGGPVLESPKLLLEAPSVPSPAPHFFLEKEVRLSPIFS